MRVYDEGDITTTYRQIRAHTAMQTYGLFVQGQHDTRPIRSTNEGQKRAVIAIIVVYVDSKMVYEADIMTS